MSVKTLAKQLPLYGQQAISTAEEPLDTGHVPHAPDIGAYIAELRDLLKAP